MSQNLTKDDYHKKSKEIFRLLNEYRKNPKLLAKHFENLKKYLDPFSNVLSEPNKVPVQMVEGETVFNESIAFLNRLPYLDPLILDENLCKSAMEHVMDIGPKGLLSYQSSDGTEPEERISKFGNYVETLGENIDFGPNDAMGVIISLTLDDGETDRPHRENLFKQEYKKLGIACGQHKTEFQLCVMDFALDFLPMETENIYEETLPGNMNVDVNKNNYFRGSDNNDIFKPTTTVTPESINPNPANTPNTSNTPNTPNVTTPNAIANSNLANPVNRNQNHINKNLDNDYPNFGELANKNIIVEPPHKQLYMENKSIISKTVEVTTRVIYHYSDGTSKESADKKRQIFMNSNK